jgi:xylulokinase
MTDAPVVGVDVGSSTARALAANRDGEVVASAAAPYPEGPIARGEVDPFNWLAGTCAAVAALDCPTPAAICVGGHGPTTVASSGERALTFRHAAGAGSSPSDHHAAQARYLREHFGATVEPRQLWDWILAQLGGSSTTQSLWPGNEPLPEFGEPIPVGTVVGISSGDHAVPAGIKLVPGSNDAYLTAWAGGIYTPGKAFDPGGRTGGLGLAVRGAEHHDAATYGMPSPVAGVYIVGGPVAAHGAMMDWWSGITGRSVPDLIALAADVPPGAYGVMALPYFEGERAPRWNFDLRAEIVGLRIEHDIGVVSRALLESTGYGLAHLAADLESQGMMLERVVSSGGPSRSKVWTGIKASILEVPIDVPDCEEMSAYGAVLGAGAAMSWWPRPGEGSSGDWPVPDMATIDPEPNEVYRAGLRRFIELGDAAEARLRARSGQHGASSDWATEGD